MPRLAKTLATILACCACVSAASLAYSAEDDELVGGWRTVNDCFLKAFVLIKGGRAQAAYGTGEEDPDAAWTWEGGTLTITSKTFPLDRFSGRLADNHMEADYTWHDLDHDQLNRQACVFERFTLGI